MIFAVEIDLIFLRASNLLVEGDHPVPSDQGVIASYICQHISLQIYVNH